MPKVDDLEIEETDIWNQEYIGKRQYRLWLKDPYTMTGSAVTRALTILEWHRIIKVEAKHVDASKDDNSDALTWYFGRKFFDCSSPMKMAEYTSTTIHDFVEPFGEKFEYPRAEYELSFNTTLNHLIRLEVYVQKTR